MYEHISVERELGVCHIRLDRPERMNVLGLGEGSNRDEIVSAARQADADEEIGCILISATGTAFCAGGDLSGSAAPGTPYDAFRWSIQLEEFYAALRSVRKPMLAAVHGLCIGGGVGFIANCDFVIAADDARFGLIEGRIGYPGATEIVPIVGGAWAKFLILSGELIDARQAEKIGLVLTVIPADRLVEAALEISRRIARIPREAAVLNKASIDAVVDAMGRPAGRLAGRAFDVTIREGARFATAPDGRHFQDILREEGMEGLKAARATQFEGSWLSGASRTPRE